MRAGRSSQNEAFHGSAAHLSLSWEMLQFRAGLRHGRPESVSTFSFEGRGLASTCQVLPWPTQPVQGIQSPDSSLVG